MRNPGGLLTISDPDAKREHIEIDTFTCVHCNRIKKVPPGTATVRVTWCKRCMGRICRWCAQFSCDPIEKKLERQEKLGNRPRIF